jgi:hypothetical protein
LNEKDQWVISKNSNSLVRALPERLVTSLPTVEELESELLIAQETKI